MASSSSTRTASATGCDGGRAGLIRALRGLYGIAGAEPGPGGRGAPLPLHDSDRAPPETAAGILGQVEAYVAGGARAVQLRVKPGIMGDGELLDLCVQATARCRNAGVLLLVNDRADLAALAGADGVHVGWDDLPPAAARAIVGPRVAAALHHVGSAHLDDPDHAIDCDVLVVADDPALRAAAMSLVGELGLSAVDAGVLENAIALEALTPVLLHINRRYGARGAGIRITGIERG